jgi:hypothetical protein
MSQEFVVLWSGCCQIEFDLGELSNLNSEIRGQTLRVSEILLKMGQNFWNNLIQVMILSLKTLRV